MKKLLFILSIFFSFHLNIFAINADSVSDSTINYFDQAKKVSLGIGRGLAYGGLAGLNVNYNLKKRLNFSFSTGFYPFMGLGFNIGTNYIFSTTKHFSFYVVGLYGLNGIDLELDGDMLFEQLYGPSLGVGSKIKMTNRQYINFLFFIPIYNSGVRKDMRDSGMNGREIYFDFKFSIGYHFSF